MDNRQSGTVPDLPSVAPMDIDLGGSCGNLTLPMSLQNTADHISKTQGCRPTCTTSSSSHPRHHFRLHVQLRFCLNTRLRLPNSCQCPPQQSSQSTTPVSLAHVMSPPQLHGQPQLSQTKLVTPQALQLQFPRVSVIWEI